MEDIKEKDQCHCEDCNCDDEKECGEDCHCEEGSCGENCHCDDDSCGEDCDCDDECCGEDCHCDEECCDENCDCESEIDDKDISQLDLALDKVKNLEDALLRSKAEFVNYKRRLEDENSRMLRFCNEDIIKELLPVIDNFERAINMDDRNLNDEVSKFLSGFKLVYCNLVEILKDFEVVEIDGINKPFNSAYHEAIMVEKADKIEPGIVLDVLQKGYILKGKVIRPAMVKVSE